MTRHIRFDVRVAPEVEQILDKAYRSGTSLRARFLTQIDRLAANGTAARAATKLTNHDLWEVRVESHRAFFRLVPGTGTIAVGVLAAKRTKRLSAARLRIIDRQVQTWVDELSDEARGGRTFDANSWRRQACARRSSASTRTKMCRSRSPTSAAPTT